MKKNDNWSQSFAPLNTAECDPVRIAGSVREKINAEKGRNITMKTNKRTDSGLARNQCVSNGGARGRHASGFVGPAVALVALLHAAGDHIKRELGELIEIHLDGAQRRCGVRAGRGAVEADDSHIVGHADAVVGKASDYSECGIVVNAEDAIDGRGASRCPRGARGTGLSSVISRLRTSLEHRLGDGMTGFDAAVADRKSVV